ncbi:MAG: preprotein translocase subunit SecE [Clostridia bacterium]|nr:preprotein translocase subunit SecE [Clostridia bacterium]
MTSVRSSKLMAVILAVMLMLTLLSATAFATDAEPAADESTAVSAENTAEPAGDSTVAADESAADDTAADTTADTAAADSDDGDNKKSVNWDLIISLSIIGLAAVLFVVFYFANKKFHERVNKFFREYKSELKKVVWSPARDVKQNTIVVIVIVAASALLIGVLDFLFSKGIIALGSLF